MLDPISVIALVAGCVSAFKDSKDLFQQWRTKRKAKKQALLKSIFEDRNDSLDHNLEVSPPKIQGEYNRLDQALGPRFRIGDDVSISQMRRSRNRFQERMIGTITSAIHKSVELNVMRLSAVADMFREDHLSSMKDLFQRVNVAKPISRGLFPDIPQAKNGKTEPEKRRRPFQFHGQVSEGMSSSFSADIWQSGPLGISPQPTGKSAHEEIDYIKAMESSLENNLMPSLEL